MLKFYYKALVSLKKNTRFSRTHFGFKINIHRVILYTDIISLTEMIICLSLADQTHDEVL